MDLNAPYQNKLGHLSVCNGIRYYLPEVESRTQGSRPRTQKNPRPRTAFPRTDTLEAKDRNARGQGPRTQSASALQKKKKRSSQKFFKRSPLKNVFQKIFQALHKILTFQKIVLSSSRGQANFRGLEASRPRPRTWPSRPRTSKCVLEDSTSAIYIGFEIAITLLMWNVNSCLDNGAIALHIGHWLLCKLAKYLVHCAFLGISCVDMVLVLTVLWLSAVIFVLNLSNIYPYWTFWNPDIIHNYEVLYINRQRSSYAKKEKSFRDSIHKLLWFTTFDNRLVDIISLLIASKLFFEVQFAKWCPNPSRSVEQRSRHRNSTCTFLY